MKNKIIVQEQIITIIEDDYISLTDMVRNIENGLVLIEKWLRNKNTIEFLGIWEEIYNTNFNSPEFEGIKNEAGLNRFSLSVKMWINKTNAIGIIAKAGRYGGTYAHKDIAFEFGTWLSPEFKLYLIKEYQRLKEAESHPLLSEWNVKRILSKVNYSIHTDAIKDFIIPKVEDFNQKLVYADEADLLNLALWGCTARQWREANPQYADKNINIRDVASINELVVLSNMESFNAELIKRKVDKSKRFTHLRQMAKEQLAHLNTIDTEKKFRILTDNDKQLE
ncbi:MAG TPA: KilA-N domain-containing protein [Flavobacterium sp.]|nr:KilA-N domain-containing protein [Flavobacterium sp.]